ncbi:HD domain-containing protein [Tenacibaculum sp. M341]|uniref:HD domain-containing protein n=1 Tax=Tenacibaculum sp. M341 TaxID=2530339 RepID=UPI001046065C|nr:hypothetical protein [Tenacibaculum sp. M341]TCI91100.1 hypothetical protein EYW44_12190 [Tenacibaculum sp. M341]
MASQLEKRFENLLIKYTDDTDFIKKFWKNIHNKYSESHRAYHNLNHLEELFRYYDQFESQLETPDTIAFSIFYHDVIYNIWKKDNEERSADYAVDELSKISLSKEILENIQEQILATKTHESSNNDSKLLIDFDLAILGQSEEIYESYTKAIRKEYKLIPNLLYKKGRKKVLLHFLDKKSIYKTETFVSLYEKKARVNLRNELKDL